MLLKVFSEFNELRIKLIVF